MSEGKLGAGSSSLTRTTRASSYLNPAAVKALEDKRE